MKLLILHLIFSIYVLNSCIHTICAFRGQNVMHMEQYVPMVVPKHAEQAKVSSFSWSNCGSKSDPIQLKNLTVKPDPVKLPGQVTLEFAADVNVTLASPVQASIQLKKHTWLGWITVPCIDNIGSCTYQDVCSILSANITCPPEFKKYGIPCKCPITKASYYLPSISTFVKLPSSVPSWLESGDYAVQATLKKGTQQLGCIAIQLSLAT